jgi:hypothetical protein
MGWSEQGHAVDFQALDDLVGHVPDDADVAGVKPVQHG